MNFRQWQSLRKSGSLNKCSAGEAAIKKIVGTTSELPKGK